VAWHSATVVALCILCAHDGSSFRPTVILVACGPQVGLNGRTSTPQTTRYQRAMDRLTGDDWTVDRSMSITPNKVSSSR